MGMYGVLYLFASILSLSIPFVYFCVPETKGRSLEDLENEYEACNYKKLRTTEVTQEQDDDEEEDEDGQFEDIDIDNMEKELLA